MTDQDAAQPSTALSVDEARWRRAQEWELEYWRQEQKRSGWKRIAYAALEPLLLATGSRRATGDDWNLWWREQFDGYAFLPHELGDYIELGCGPYTNTRLILEGRSAKRVVCSDPLAGEYVTFRNRWLARAHASGRIELDTHSIEDLEFPPHSFDTVVLINVLDHVRDARRCMEVTSQLLRPSGILIFGQDLADPGSFGNPDYAWFEEGHPIRPTESDIVHWLGAFEPLFEKRVPPRDPRLQTGVLAFAGRKP